MLRWEERGMAVDKKSKDEETKLGMSPTEAKDARFTIAALNQEVERQERRLRHQRLAATLAYVTAIAVILSSGLFIYSERKLRREVNELITDVEAVMQIEKAAAANGKKLGEAFELLDQRIQVLEQDPRSLSLTIGPDKTKK